MKKIMVIIVAGLAVAMANAASVSWLLNRDDAKTWGGADIYAFDAANLSAVTALLDKGGENVAKDFVNNFALGGGVAGSANSRGAAEGELDVGSASSIMFVIFENNTIADGNAYHMTDAIATEGLTYTPPENIPGFMEFEATAFGSEGTVAAPEPTSGLLLLLGVAGLALRRRRA